jgi:hypothetical protein
MGDVDGGIGPRFDSILYTPRTTNPFSHFIHLALSGFNRLHKPFLWLSVFRVAPIIAPDLTFWILLRSIITIHLIYI